MMTAHTPKSASAVEPRRNYTSPAPRPDIAQAVADIRAACAIVARLTARDISFKKGVQQ